MAEKLVFEAKVTDAPGVAKLTIAEMRFWYDCAVARVAKK